MNFFWVKVKVNYTQSFQLQLLLSYWKYHWCQLTFPMLHIPCVECLRPLDWLEKLSESCWQSLDLAGFRLKVNQQFSCEIQLFKSEYVFLSAISKYSNYCAVHSTRRTLYSIHLLVTRTGCVEMQNKSSGVIFPSNKNPVSMAFEYWRVQCHQFSQITQNTIKPSYRSNR